MPKKDNDCWEARKLFEALRHDQRWVVDRLLALSTEVHGLSHHGEPCSGAEGHTGIHVTDVKLKREGTLMPPTDHMPDFTLPSIASEAGLSVVGPKKADGSYATGGSWATSDEAALPLVAQPDTVALQADPAWLDPGDGSTAPLVPVLDDQGNQIPIYNVTAKTPLEPEAGSTAGGVVTWSAPGMASVDIKVSYGDPALGHAAITAQVLPEAA